MEPGGQTIEEFDQELTRRIELTLPNIEKALQEYEDREVSGETERRLQNLRIWKDMLVRLKERQGAFESPLERLRAFKQFCQAMGY